MRKAEAEQSAAADVPDLGQLMRKAASDSRVIGLGGGLPASDTFPRRALAKAAGAAVLDLGRDPLQYHWPEGRTELRAQIAARLRARGADVVADDVVLTNGAQDALSLAVDVLAPRAIHVGRESYPAAIDLFRAKRCAPRDDARLAVHYAMPAVHNPYGRALTPAERARALSARYVIEDDAYAELRFDGRLPRPLIAEARERVLHVGTFSKTLSPGLRVGWLVAPQALRERVREENGRRALHGGTLAQAMVERLLAEGGYDARLARLRRIYASRCRRLMRPLSQLPHLHFRMPEGGFAIWVESELRCDDLALLAQAVRSGVSFDPGSTFRPEPRPNEPLSFRLSFSATDPSLFEQGVARLARVLARAARASRSR